MKTLNATATAGLVLCGSLTTGMAQDKKPDVTVDFSQVTEDVAYGLAAFLKTRAHAPDPF